MNFCCTVSVFFIYLILISPDLLSAHIFTTNCIENGGLKNMSLSIEILQYGIEHYDKATKSNSYLGSELMIGRGCELWFT